MLSFIVFLGEKVNMKKMGHVIYNILCIACKDIMPGTELFGCEQASLHVLAI